MSIQQSPVSYESFPVVTFDTTRLDFDLFQVDRNAELIKDTIAKLPRETFNIVIFASSINAKNIALNPLNLLKLFSLVPDEVLDSLNKVFVVHGSVLFSSLLKLSSFLKLKNYQFGVINCEGLDELGAFLPLADLPISLGVQRCEPCKYQAVDGLQLNSALTDWNEYAVLRFMSIYNNFSLFISKRSASVGRRTWLNLISLSVEEDSTLNCNILTALINQKAYLDLTQWSFLEHFFVLVTYFQRLNDMSKPLVPMIVLTAPQDNRSFDQLLESILVHNQYNYKNAYMTMKVFQLIKQLFLNLRDHIYRNSENLDSKKLERYIGRQETRFVLSMTKIFYNELGGEVKEDFEFEMMFEFWNNFLKKFDFCKLNVGGSSLKLKTKIDLEEWQSFDRQIRHSETRSAASQSSLHGGSSIFFDKPTLRTTFSTLEKASKKKKSNDISFKVEIKGSEKVKQLTKLYEERFLQG